MCTFDLLSINNCADRTCRVNHLIGRELDLCISDRVVETIISTYENDSSYVSDYFFQVREKALRIDKQLIIIVQTQLTNYRAQTNLYRSSIDIDLSRDRLFLGNERPDFLNKDGRVADIRYVFIHELRSLQRL
jgi:hypothetical protein